MKASRKGQASQFRLTSRAVPVTQDVQAVFFKSRSVVNDVRFRNQFAHTRAFRIRRAGQWEIFQNRNTINQRVAHSHSSIWMVFGNEIDGGLQVRNRLRREDYFAAHDPTRLRTSSIETPLPASTSRIASSSERNKRCSSSAVISGSLWELSHNCKAFRSLPGSWATAS